MADLNSMDTAAAAAEAPAANAKKRKADVSLDEEADNVADFLEARLLSLHQQTLLCACMTLCSLLLRACVAEAVPCVHPPLINPVGQLCICRHGVSLYIQGQPRAP